MTSLPKNNLDEHLARFTAAKKNISPNSGNGNSKQFTFKKSASLVKHIVPSKTGPALQSLENKIHNLRPNETSSVKNILKNVNKPILKKQGTITNFFTNPGPKKLDSKEISDPLISNSFFGDDELFPDDLSDFDIPSSKAVKHLGNHVQTTSSSKFKENTKDFSGKASKIPGRNEVLNKDAVPTESICSFEDPISFFEELDDDDVLCSTARKKNTKRIVSDDESDISDSIISSRTRTNNLEIESKKDSDINCKFNGSDKALSVPTFPVKINASPVLKSMQDLNDYEYKLTALEQKVTGCITRDLEPVLSSLRELNISVMTKICDTIQDQPELLKQNQDLSYLVNIWQRVIQQYKAAESSFSTHSKLPRIVPKFNAAEKSFVDGNLCEKPPQEMRNLKLLPLFSTANQLLAKASSSGLMPDSNLNPLLEKSSSDQVNISEFPKSRNSFNKSIPHIEDIETQELHPHIYDISDDDSNILSLDENIQNKEDEKIITGNFIGNQRDDGTSSKFKGMNFPFSKDLLNVFHNIFGLKTFRHNQLEAINAALLKEDCFILMPTGGGKSLCYQLPSLVTSGVTIVISPLRSLIMDQVQKLCSLDITASSLTGDTDAGTSNFIYQQLSSREPNLKLLYVTPEKISASAKLISSLENLYARNMIQRFVIDEAHCVSQWGHDFRPDYKRLKILREKFSNVPMMALTATATQRVRSDILHQLGMKSPKWFLQSFNRPNLKYEVRPKAKSIVADIMELIKSKFRNMCGIIYCLSRNDCDNVAHELCQNGIKAAPYHAGLNNREEIQEQWINDKFKVICATIAFGMGIDKPDVRYVIHHAIPKSIEGYYQESGRAGRDGEISWCILYYAYKDMHRIKRMIMKDDTNKHSWTTHFDNLYKMVHFCENKTDCRRVWMLQYFGEIFDKNLCLKDARSTCDNCFSKEVFVNHDVTEDAKAIIHCVAQLVDKRKRQNYTLTHFVDIFKGAKIQKILTAGHNKLSLYGRGQQMRRSDVERLMRKLVLDNFLYEDMVMNHLDIPMNYIYLGKRYKELMAGKVKVVMPFQKGTKNKASISNVVVIEDKETKQLIDRCYDELIEVSKDIARERSMHYTNVINVEALRQMSREMPLAEEDMLSISHVTKAVYEKYGKRFLEVTQKYAAERCVLDAEKADKDMLSALVDDVDNWSDAEPPTTAKKGVKRKFGKKSKVEGPKKKQKVFKKAWQKAKFKNSSSSNGKSAWNKKKTTMRTAQAATKTPGFLPMPKPLSKPSRSFLQAPQIAFFKS